jgi:hypothetical protein
MGYGHSKDNLMTNNNIEIVYLHREGIGGEHEKQLIAICNGWHPRLLAQ